MNSAGQPELTTGDFARMDGAAYRSAPYEVPNAGTGLRFGGGGLGLQWTPGAVAAMDDGINEARGNRTLVAMRDSDIDAQTARLSAAQQRAAQQTVAAWSGGAGGGRGFVNPDWTNPYSGNVSRLTAAANVAAVPTDRVGNWIKSLNMPEIPGVGWLSQEQAVSSAQHWQGRLDETGNPVYALAQGVANLWADHAPEVGMVLAGVRGVQPSVAGVPINGATRTAPLGFTPEEQFLTAAQQLQGALRQSGITDATVGVRGSSVTGYSLTKGTQFGPRSDIDFFVESQQLTGGYSTSKNIPGFVHPNKILPDYPLLQDWATKWTNILGRNVTPGAFGPGTLPSQPSIVVKPVGPGG